MSTRRLATIPDAIRLLNECRFDEAISMAQGLLRAAAEESSERLKEAARAVVAWRGIFRSASEEAASEPYFRAVFALLEELAGAGSPAAMAAAENLAGLLGAVDKLDEAIALRERVFAHVRERFPIDDARFMNVRDGLAFLYRRAGRDDAADELYQHTGICAHLQPAEQYLRHHGAKLTFCGQPWTDNCHIWVFFDRVLDCEGLMAALKLEACVQIHDHRGPHDGSERGLVCNIHNDGLMGPHPLDAGPEVKSINQS